MEVMKILRLARRIQVVHKHAHMFIKVDDISMMP